MELRRKRKKRVLHKSQDWKKEFFNNKRYFHFEFTILISYFLLQEKAKIPRTKLKKHVNTLTLFYRVDRLNTAINLKLSCMILRRTSPRDEATHALFHASMLLCCSISPSYRLQSLSVHALKICLNRCALKFCCCKVA
jgi:predicted membrane channel-forming protein YqfA (hemolysin III family)